MPEQFKTCRSKYQGEAELKKNYAKLGRKITDCIPHKIKGLTTDDPEYWGLRELLNDDMVEVANKMKLRKFYTYEELLKMNPRFEPVDLQKLLDEMSYIGIIEYDYGDNYDHDGELKDKPRIKRYRVPYFVPGAAELFNSSQDRVDRNPAAGNFFERMTFIPLKGVTQMVPPGGGGIGMHVLPVEEAIKFENKSVDLEEISYWLKKYEGHISSGICSCRATMKKMGEGCGDDSENWCIQVGDMADYAVETDRAHYIDVEEALRIIKKAEENGFVHEITNIDGENKIFDICNCDVKVCYALRTALLFNTPNMVRSAYRAKVKKENCVACGGCAEVCPAGAVKLGQKLLKKDGTEQSYPKTILPDNVIWGKYAWDENYRDTARLCNTYESGSAPCKSACPAHISIQGYLKKAHEGKFEEALAIIKKANPFPAVCGRICNKPCEAACTRGTVDQPVAIDAVKKFIADRELKAEKRYIPPKNAPTTNEEGFDDKIAIIGAGPAGLSCAYYLALLGYKPVVFEKNEKPGGMMTYGIPSYKLEKDVIEAEIEVLRQLGVSIRTSCQVGRDVTLDQLRQEGYKAFYVAVGCQGGRLPGIPNDTVEGTDYAVHYLQESLSGGQAPFKGKVVVIGGGNVAIDCAMTAAKRGASEVSMISLETREEMPASESEIAEAEEEKVQIINSWGPKEVLVDEQKKVKGLVLKRCTRTIDPESGRFSPLYDEDETMTVEADFIIFAIGQAILWEGLLDGSKVKYHHGNYPMADPLTFQTDEEDIFVGGDDFTGPKFVIDAIAQGHFAAESLHRYVRQAHMTIGRERHQYKAFDTADITLPASYDTAGRQEEPMDASISDAFRDRMLTLTEEQVHLETGRCLSCGAAEVDQNKCIGCGLCTTRCEFDAIHITRDLPEMTHMLAGEQKPAAVMGYSMKRAFRILTHAGTPEAKEMRRRRKAYKRANKAFNREHPDIGNAYHA